MGQQFLTTTGGLRGQALEHGAQVMPRGRVEDVADPLKGRFGPGSHDQRLGVHSDHCCNSRIQAPKAPTAESGQAIVVVAVPRRNWI